MSKNDAHKDEEGVQLSFPELHLIFRFAFGVLEVQAPHLRVLSELMLSRLDSIVGWRTALSFLSFSTIACIVILDVISSATKDVLDGGAAYLGG
jgi:hypothetical protein